MVSLYQALLLLGLRKEPKGHWCLCSETHEKGFGSVRCAVQCTEFARKIEHFRAFINPGQAAVVTMVDLVGRLLLGSGLNCRYER